MSESFIPCCGTPAFCQSTSRCITRITYRHKMKNTDVDLTATEETEAFEKAFAAATSSVQSVINAATHGSEPQVMPANPKQKYGDIKVPLNLFPTTAIAVGSMAFLEGREKYGQDNFRGAPIEAMTYVRAALSHLNLYAEGEWSSDDSPVPHLGSALASIAIIIDAHYAGSLVDNRKFPGGYTKAIAEMGPLVQKLRDIHADKNPKHYTIADAKKEPV